jgi:hypothetical protein
MNCKSLFEHAEQILLSVRRFATDDSDVVWTTWDTPTQMRAEIDACLEKIRKHNIEGIKRAAFFFLPTSDFQEHSISNGWTDEYMRLSTLFDQVDQSLKGCC